MEGTVIFAQLITTLALSVTGLGLAGPTPDVAAADGEATALDAVNHFRTMAGVAAVTLDPVQAQAAMAHSCYMLQNGFSHDEVPGRPGYTTAGDAAGNAGNVAVSSATSMSDRAYVELWITGPFHAIGMLRPELTSVGFGTCSNPDASPWRSAGTLDVMSGLSGSGAIAAPIVWPGDGTTTNLNHFIAETPSPVSMCGWPSGGGLPVIAMMPEAPSQVSASITGPDGPLETCALYAGNVRDSDAASILGGANAVTVLPRNPLAPGLYAVTVTTAARTVNWSFTVDPAVADMQPVAPAPLVDAKILAAPGGFTAVDPYRLADTRTAGGVRLVPNTVRRIQVTGTGKVPSGTTAVSTNVTAVAPDGAGFIAAYSCTPDVPTVSTVNFSAGAVVANAAIVALDSAGGLCLSANVAADVVIDVNGYTSTNSLGRLVPIAPRRLLDTRVWLAGSRLSSDGILSVNVAGGGTDIPDGARAVVLTVTAVSPSQSTYITVYPCGMDRPTVSSLNVVRGATQSNTVIVPVGDAGTVCFSSPHDVDLVGDVSGYMIDSARAGLRFTPLSATRLVDTRNPQLRIDPALGVTPLPAATDQRIRLAGVRGVPSAAMVASVNITTTVSSGNGFVTAWNCNGARPNVSALNTVRGLSVSAAAMGQLTTEGSTCLFSQTATHLIVDINGFWAP